MRRAPFVRIGQLAPGDPRRAIVERIADPARSAFARSRDYRADSMDGYSEAVALGGDAYPPFGGGAGALELVVPGGNADLNPGAVHENVPSSTVPPASPIFDELRFADFANAGLALTNASAKILARPPGNAKRVYFFFVNTDAADTLFLAFDRDADALSGLPIAPNFGFIEYAIVLPQNDIYCISSAVASTAVMIFANKGAPNLAGVSLRAPMLEQAYAPRAPAAPRELTYCQVNPSAEGCRNPSFWGHFYSAAEFNRRSRG